MLEVGLDGVSEAAGVQQASGDVVVGVAESQGYAPEGLEPSVDGFGGPVRAVLPVEEREDVAHAFLQGAAQGREFGAAGPRAPPAASDSMSSAIMPRPFSRSLCA